jgi:GT2 family glycosyltransferase
VTALTTVAIPVRNGGRRLLEVLEAVAGQQVEGEVELLVCDSGSTDGSAALARSHGAEVISIEPGEFGHGRTRNLLMERAQGAHVALLTQDALPAGAGWLSALLDGFSLAPRTGLVFGPYLPRPGASPMVARELAAWFGSLAPDGAPRVDLATPQDRGAAPATFYGPRGYFTDANGCLARAAWEEVRFRDVAYAEDHLLAQDMLRAGYAKVFVPGAAVIHSHDYSPWQWVRRSFDEARAVTEVYGVHPGGSPRTALRTLRGTVGADWRESGRRPQSLVASVAHHGPRAAGALLGAHAAQLPGILAAKLSLEGRR